MWNLSLLPLSVEQHNHFILLAKGGSIMKTLRERMLVKVRGK
jgi:hypothetical protein